MMDNEHAGRQLMLRKRSVAEETLKLLRENSPEMTEVHPGLYSHSQSVLDGLGEGLENNTKVTSLILFPLRGQRLNEGNMEKILLFVEKSESLKCLCCMDLPDNFTGELLVSLSRRKNRLTDLSLPVIGPQHLDAFESFLRDTPMTKQLTVRFKDVPTVMDPQLSATLLASAATAKIEHFRLDTAECPFDFLTAFKGNSNVKEVTIIFNSNFSDVENRRKLESLRGCKNAHYNALLSFDGIDWDRELWDVLVNELQGLDAIKKLHFTEIDDFPEFCTEVLPKLFEGTKRKLEFGWINIDLDEKLFDAIVASTIHFDTGYLFHSPETMTDLLCALTKPTAVMESLEMPLSTNEDFDAFVEFAPQFRSLKSLSLEVHADFVDEDCDARLHLNKIKDALWKNRSLTGKIELTGDECINDSDRAFVERILQRNRRLPELLDPRHLINVPPPLIPLLFHHSCETDTNELYQAIGSSVLLTFPRNKRHES